MKKRVIRKTGGRNNRGRITVRHRGGGQKRQERVLDYNKGKHRIEISGVVERVVYDPNRTAYVGECQGGTRKVYKIIGGPEGVTEVKIGKELKVVKLKEVGVGEMVYKVSERVGEEGKIARAAGAGCKVIKQGERETVIRLPSGKVKELMGENTCYEGVVWGREKEKLGKAGGNRRRGRRPTVRGAAMNAVDHPNGGKTPGGQPYTPWGKLGK